MVLRRGKLLLPRAAKAWIAVRRPLLVAFVLGCSVSLMTSGRVTLRLAGPATVYWSFLPLAGIAGLAVVSGRGLHAETIDEFFHGYLPWMLLIVAFAAIWAFVPAPVAFARTDDPLVWEGLAVVPLVWSSRTDLHFFERMFGCNRREAMRNLLIHRLVSWPIALAIFVWSAGVQVIASGLGL
jgi:hypothetical protein